MSDEIEMPKDEVLRFAIQMTTQQITTDIAQKAREFAKTVPDGITAAQVLIAFADAIDSTNAKQFGYGGKQ